MARNDILQIVVFSLFFGLGLNALKSEPRVDAADRAASTASCPRCCG